MTGNSTHLAPLFALASAVPFGQPPTRDRWISADVTALFSVTAVQSFPTMPPMDRYALVDEMLSAFAKHLDSMNRRASRNPHDRINLWLVDQTPADVLDELFKLSELLDGQADR